MFENVSTCDTCISPEKDKISSLVYHDSMIQVVISNPVTLSIIHFHPYLFFHLYADLFFANLLIITLSLSLVLMRNRSPLWCLFFGHWLRLPGLGNNNEKLGLPERLSAGIQFRFRNLFHGKISGNRNFIC